MKIVNAIVLSVMLAFFGCSTQDDVLSSTWSIPSDQVFDGGPGKDGIPSVDNPNFSAVEAIDFLSDNDLVIGIKVGEEVRAYPHPILDWHEIVNDVVDSVQVAITYCPLTGTGIGWNRKINGRVTEFGVSGLLYNTNLIPYDRNTDSNWSQMGLDCVNGELLGETIELVPLIETTWATWKKRFPDSKVMNLNTGFARSYGNYPYGDYRTSERLLFPITNEDSRLPKKSRVLGVLIDGAAKVYPIDQLGTNGIEVKADNFNGQDLVLFGSRSDNFLVAYNSVVGNRKLEFEAVQDGGAVVAVDNEGNEWSLWGEALNGPRAGTQLKAIDAYIGYFFAWAAFQPALNLY